MTTTLDNMIISAKWEAFLREAGYPLIDPDKPTYDGTFPPCWRPINCADHSSPLVTIKVLEAPDAVRVLKYSAPCRECKTPIRVEAQRADNSDADFMAAWEHAGFLSLWNTLTYS